MTADEPRGGGSGALRVMLVDDHALVRAAVAQAIAAPDIVIVAEARFAEEALELAARERPDLALVDVNLPGMSGLELLRELRVRVPETSVIMLSATSVDRDVEDAALAGAVGYLTKDVAPDALRRTIRGYRAGQLPMPRALAMTLLLRLADAAQRRAPSGDDVALTGRQKEVLRLLSEGRTNREIAAALSLSPRTVERHVGGILDRLGVPNRAAAARRYRDGA
jgi:DNA-binding NarL/FixJ family response regulator